MTYLDVNQEFKDKIDLLYNDGKGIKIKVIADKSGIPNSKLLNIRTGRSSAKAKELNALKEAYPDIFKENEADIKPDEKFKALEEDVKNLKSEVNNLKEVTQVLLIENKKRDMEKERTIQELREERDALRQELDELKERLAEKETAQ